MVDEQQKELRKHYKISDEDRELIEEFERRDMPIARVTSYSIEHGNIDRLESEIERRMRRVKEAREEVEEAENMKEKREKKRSYERVKNFVKKDMNYVMAKMKRQVKQENIKRENKKKFHDAIDIARDIRVKLDMTTVKDKQNKKIRM